MGAFDNISEHELLALFHQGSEAAFTEIYSRYWNKLLAIAFNHTKDKSSAQEIVQELFVALWKRRGNSEVVSLNNYLAVATRFAVYKHFEKDRRRREIESLGGTIDYIDEEGMMEAKFLQEYIDSQVELLPEKCRMVFRYSRNDGFSIPEIAEEMGISEKTVEAHLTKGLKTVRGSLKDSGMLSLIAGAAFHHWLN